MIRKIPKRSQLKIITLHPGKQYLDEGAFGVIYRISPRRIVKIFKTPWTEEDERQAMEKTAAQDELEGSLLSKYALPVLRVVLVKFTYSTNNKRRYNVLDNRKYLGLVREYLPCKCTDKDANLIRSKVKSPKLTWDLSQRNIRKNKQGRIFIVDTDSSEWTS